MDPIALNVEGVKQLIGSKVNKTDGSSFDGENDVSEKIDSLSLEMTDDELLRLSKRWITKYSKYEDAIKKRQEANLTYYLGRQKESTSVVSTDGQSISANLLFEAEETFLPQALKNNPDPVVFSDNSEEGDAISTSVKTMLQYHADVLVLRRKLWKVVRHWSIYFVGIMKHGWDDEIKEITSEVRNPKDFILDPDGFVDEYADYVGYLGEKITVTAERLIELFPKHESYIKIMVDGKLGTDVTYIEWWTDKYTFTTFREMVLDKSKNPFFNHKRKDLITGEEKDGRNHFAREKKPYTFLSIFSLGETPHDVTNLIEQNIPNQRRVTRRTEQIDYNLSRQNNSTVFSEDNFTQEEAKQAATALAKGHPILVPPGKPMKEAVDKIEMSPVPPAFFNALENDKNDLRTIFGVEGLTAQPPEPNELATGIIKNEQHDSTRIGGGIGDALEQFCDNVFNWWTQLYYVFYDEAHYGAILGKMKAVELVRLQSQDITKKIVVSVSPNSMRPHDEVSEMNQAIMLFKDGILDPKTLFTRINFPDADKTAEQTVLWLMDKEMYVQANFPNLAQALQQKALQQAQAQQQLQQQQLAQEEAQVGQQLNHKEQTHQQKLRHNEEVFNQKKQLQTNKK